MSTGIQVCPTIAAFNAVKSTADGALQRSGGTMTGNLILKDHGLYMDITQGDNSLSSRSANQYRGWGCRDKNGRLASYFQTILRTDGYVITEVAARRWRNDANADNKLQIAVAPDGSATYWVTNPANFRSAIGAAASSDRRLKSDISPLEEDAVGFVRKLRPAVYTINRKREVGLIAQDVKEADPWDTDMAFETVEGVDGLDDWEKMPDGSPTWKLRYERIVPPLVAAVQNALTRIEELEAKVQQLERERERERRPIFPRRISPWGFRKAEPLGWCA